MMQQVSRSIALTIVLFSAVAFAQDSFYSVPVQKLTLTEGTLPAPSGERTWRGGERAAAMQVYVVLDGSKGEAYVSDDPQNRFSTAGYSGNETVSIRAPQGQAVSGRLLLPKPDWSGMIALKFELTAAATAEGARDAFLRAKRAHYEQLMNRQIAGTAWFRHQAIETKRELGDAAKEPAPIVNVNRAPHELEDTYAMFTGGRAVSESLQLDRVLPATTKSEEANVDVDSLTGITVAEIDWKPITKDLNPKVDPLAAVIPADQHAIFFSSFDAAMTVIDEADRNGTPVLQLAEPRSEDARTKERYQRQLCLSLTGLGRLLGPQVISSVAVTGSDPYLRVGSDVAVIFEAKDATSLEKLLLTQVRLASATIDGIASAPPVKGNVTGVAYEGTRSADRRICSYVARLGEHAVVVTNSLVQLQNLINAQQGKTPALAAAPEYVFFRDRYPRDDAEGTAFLILTDATIRRWCGPRWRIADSRRTRAAALMTELQAEHLDELARNAVEAGPIHTDRLLADSGEMRLTPAGVTSSTYGSLDFMTPIAELDLKNVSKTEADTYNRWRQGYQSNWRRFFDPIGVRFTIQPRKLAADVTVMPLILRSEYRQILDMSKGAALLAGSGDPHDALLHWVLALNPKSPVLQGYNVWAKGMVGQAIDPLSWLGQSIAIYADDDPFWAEMIKAPKLEDFFHTQFHRLPLALRFEAGSVLKLTAFLTGLHGFIDQSAPGMTVWEPQSYKDQPYVKITPSANAKGESKDLDKLSIYYLATGEALTVTLNEDLLKRAIDRQQARRIAASQPADQKVIAAMPTSRPWLGTSVGVQATAGILPVLKKLAAEESPYMQLRAWGNIPILNEWKRLYPDQDPVQLHERLWQTHLIDPAGGKYVWNDQWQTMESTAYGNPAAPKDGPGTPAMLESFLSANFGISFEDQGLRAKVALERGVAK